MRIEEGSVALHDHDHTGLRCGFHGRDGEARRGLETRLHRDSRLGIVDGMDRNEITAELVRRLLAEQFPEWADLPLTPVERSGWDNITMRLGETMSVRLPSADMYATQVDKEHAWLPRIRDHVSVDVPRPLGKGRPSDLFPRPWSVYAWLPGEQVAVDRVHDLERLAADVAHFLNTLYRVDTTGGPAAGLHSFYRGAVPGHWDESARTAIDALGDVIDTSLATDVWETALSSTWSAAPVWFHGDMSAGNMLARDGRLSAVIDFGTCGIGDPACDLVVAWSLFEGASREAFRRALDLDDDTWARARGWMLWKAAITLRQAREEAPAEAGTAGAEFGWRVGAQQVLDDVMAEHSSLTTR